MMTVFEKAHDRIDSLRDAELNCLEAGASTMAAVWGDLRRKLEDKTRAMSVALACVNYTESMAAAEIRHLMRARS